MIAGTLHDYVNAFQKQDARMREKRGTMNPSLRICICWILLSLAGCSGVKTFPNRVGAGETITIAAGWKQHYSRDNLVVTITPEGQATTTIPADHVRASIHVYPDPLSSLTLSQQTGTDISFGSASYAGAINFLTSGDTDWWQNMIFVNIPTDTPTGNASITINNPEGETTTTEVLVVAPDPIHGGTEDSFDAQFLGPMSDLQLTAMERVDHYVVTFDGLMPPHAIQLDLSYADISGHIVNPNGLVKNIFWNDDSSSGKFRVLLTPVTTQSFQDIQELKFYVAITSGTAAAAAVSLAPDSLHAVDENGEDIPGISVNIALVRGAAGLN